MPYTTLITPAELAPHLSEPDDWAVIDCRFSLDAPERGRRDYTEAHIPGAVYAHLDEDLSGPVMPGKTSRHPLPPVETLRETFSNWGLTKDVQVVAYDDMGGAVAARLWWMLRWLGHDQVAVLDGGWPRWQHEGYPVRGGQEQRPARPFTPHPDPTLLADVHLVESVRQDSGYCLLDARDAARYRGEHEPIDAVAGHIPGAHSAPFKENLDDAGRFLPREQLRARFEGLVGSTPDEHIICYCGSGVTAAHDLLALAHAGWQRARLYAGSWSEWITDPEHPVEP